MTVWEIWESSFGETPPIAHVVRPSLPDRWLRIHSLPESKRYPQSRKEYTELLFRHNEVAGEVLGAEGEVLLFISAFLKENHKLPRALAKFSWSRAFQFDAAPQLVYQPNPEDRRMVVAGSPILWYPGAWDTLIKNVADNHLPAPVFFNPKSGEIYSPYDGGADLFPTTPARAADLRRRWAAWLPATPPKADPESPHKIDS